MHFLELWHLYKDLMDFILGKTCENVGTSGLVQLFLRCAFFLEVLQVSDSVALVADILLQRTTH